MKQKITSHLWFDKEAKEAAEFYASIFPDSKIINVTTLHNTPEQIDRLTQAFLPMKKFDIKKLEEAYKKN